MHSLTAYECFFEIHLLQKSNNTLQCTYVRYETYVTNYHKVGASSFLTKEKIVVGVTHSNFRTVANVAVRTYEPKFIL